MSIVRMLKTFAAAALAVSASFAANAAEVIAINFGTHDGRTVPNDAYVVSDVTGISITGDAWNNVSANANGTNETLTRYWNGSEGAALSQTVKVSWTSANLYQWDDGGNESYQKGYLDDGNGGATVSVTGIPYAVYDLIIYASSDNAPNGFKPFAVNGVSYTYISGDEATEGTSVWGERVAGPQLGKNALKITGLTGALNIQGGPGGNNSRGGIAAIQIVESNGPATKLPGADFTYGPNPSVVSGWFTSWTGLGNVRMVGPEGMDALAINADGNCQYQNVANVNDKKAFTIAAIVNVDNVHPDDGKYAVLWSFGNFSNGRLGLMLTKGGDNLYLQHTYKRNGNNYRFGPYTPKDGDDQSKPYCVASGISRGFHLVVATFDVTNQRMTLKVDDGNPVVATGSGNLEKLSDGGMQLGNAFGHIGDPLVTGLGVAFDRIMAWDSALTDEQQTTLWNQYSSVVTTPIAPSYDSDFATQNGTIYVPDLETTRALRIQRGTMQLPDDVTAKVQAVCFGNYGNAAEANNTSYTFNLAGTLAVTSESTDYNVYNDRGNTGVLLGHWQGSGTVNVTGTLAATNAFIQTEYNSFKNLALNINGGKVTTRGLYAAVAGSTVNISNGGTLELAEFHSGAAIPLTSAGGTIRAIESGDYNSGWTWNGTVALSGGTTTIDPNGKEIIFSGAASGAGGLAVNDTSAGGSGTVKFDQASALMGDISVQSGTLDIGAARPSGTITFAQGAKLVIVESLADGNDRIALKIAGDLAAGNVTLSRADGTAYEGTLTVETDLETNLKYIAFETNTNPDVSGAACWYDFEFENNKDSTGHIGGSLNTEGNNGINRLEGYTDFVDPNNEYAGVALYTAAESWMDVTYPDSWSAAVYATIPQQENAVLMTFGTNAGGFIGLICGDPEKNEVKLVRTTGNSAYATLATMTVPYAYTVPHLYVFSKSANKIEIYLDGKLAQPYTSQTAITFGPGFQIGSVHGNPGNTGVARFSADLVDGELPEVYANSWIGMLRMYDSTLSQEASAKLAEEFPYISPSDAFTRELNGGTINWTATDAWQKGGEAEPYDAPTENSVVELTATADTTIILSTDVALESLTVKGTGKVTFAMANGATLAVSGTTEIDTDTVLPHAVSVGVVDIDAAATLTFDYSGYDIALNAPNGGFAATGLVNGSGTVEFIQPANKKGRTFTFALNADNGQWYVNYSRPAYTLYWVGTAATGDWSALDVWKKDSANGDEAAFLEGDSVVFGDVYGVNAVTVTIPQTVTVGGIAVNAPNTDYTINGTINVDGASITVASDTAITGLAGTAGTVAIAGSEVTLGSSSALAIATAATVDANTALKIGGNGTITYTGGGTAFQGTLEVVQGTFVVDCQFNSVTATEENPIKVTGTGHLFFKAAANAGGNRLAANGFITVEGATALLEVEGNNTFPRSSGTDDLGLTTITCRNGGVFQVNGVDQYYNIHVKDVILDSGVVRLSGTVASWGRNRGLEIDGSLVSTGESYLTRPTGAADRLVLRGNTVNVESGTLHWEVMAEYNEIIKTGAGALVFGGNNGGTRDGNGTVTVNGGTLVASERLAGAAKNISLAAGTTFEIPADIALPFAIPDRQTWTLTGRPTLFLNTESVKAASKVLSWTQGNKPVGKFSVRTAGGKSFSVVMRDDGAYLTIGFLLILR